MNVCLPMSLVIPTLFVRIQMVLTVAYAVLVTEVMVRHVKTSTNVNYKYTNVTRTQHVLTLKAHTGASVIQVSKAMDVNVLTSTNVRPTNIIAIEMQTVLTFRVVSVAVANSTMLVMVFSPVLMSMNVKMELTIALQMLYVIIHTVPMNASVSNRLQRV